MRLFFTSLIIFFCNSFTFAQSLPKEWLLLLECVQNNQKKLLPQNLTDIQNSVSTFNNNLNHIPSDRVSAFMKALLYRQLLETPPIQKIGGNNINASTIDTFFKSQKNATCAFTTWLIESMESDYLTLKKQGGFNDSNTLGPNSPVLAKSSTLQRYISQWIVFLKSSSSDKEVNLMNYYSQLIIKSGKLLKTFFEFSPQQPNGVTYLRWSTDSSWVDQKSITSPEVKSEEKSAAEIIEHNLPSNSKNEKDKSVIIDELIKQKNKEQTGQP